MTKIFELFFKYKRLIIIFIIFIFIGLGVGLGVYFGKILPDKNNANNTNNIKNTDDLYVCGPNVNKKCEPPYNYCNNYKNKNRYICQKEPLNSSDIINITEYNADNTPSPPTPPSSSPTLNNTDECGPNTLNKCGPNAKYCTYHTAIKNYYCTQFLKNNNYETNIPKYNFEENGTSKECYKNKNCNNIDKPFCNLNKCSSTSNLTDFNEYKNYNKNDITYCGNTMNPSLCNNNNYCVAIDIDKPKSKYVGYCTNDIKTVDNSTIICITGDDCPGNLVCDKSINGFSTCVPEINKICSDTTECIDDIIGKEKLKNNFNNVNPYKCCTDFYSKTRLYNNTPYIDKIGIKDKSGYCKNSKSSPCVQEKKCLDPGYIPILKDNQCTPENYKNFNAELSTNNLNNNFKFDYDPDFPDNEQKKIYIFKK